jgi:hypothetical protein
LQLRLGRPEGLTATVPEQRPEAGITLPWRAPMVTDVRPAYQ